MKQLLIILVPLLFSSTAIRSQSPSHEERRLTNYILKECSWSDGIDSARVLTAVMHMLDLYGVKRVRFIRNKTGSSHFIPFIGVLYLNLKDTANVCRILSAELAHAAQFSARPFHYVRKTFGACIEAFFTSFVLSRAERKQVRKLMSEKGCPRWKAKLWVAWGRQYRRGNTLEGEAHILIEPMIYEQLMLAIYRIPVGIALGPSSP